MGQCCCLSAEGDNSQSCSMSKRCGAVLRCGDAPKVLVFCKPCPAAAARGPVDAYGNFMVKGTQFFLNSWAFYELLLPQSGA